MFEIIGMLAVWLVGAVASVYIPALLVMAFMRGGLETMAVAVWAGKICLVIYLMGSMAYFAAT